jgi:hypothetical protein
MSLQAGKSETDRTWIPPRDTSFELARYDNRLQIVSAINFDPAITGVGGS